MVRQLRRKPIEEVYGGAKYEANASKSHGIPMHGTTKTSTMRAERRHGGVVNVGGATCPGTSTGGVTIASAGLATGRGQHSEYTTSNNYIITSNCPITTTNLQRTGGGGVVGQSMHQQQQHRHQMHQNQMHQNQMHQNQMQVSARNKTLTARQANAKKPGTCYQAEPIYCGDGLPSMMAKSVASGKDTQRPRQHSCWKDATYMGVGLGMGMGGGGGGGGGGVAAVECSKHENYHKHGHAHHMHKHAAAHDRQSGGSAPYQHRQHQQCNTTTTPTKTHSPKEDDDDDDPDEFFDLIRQTVQSAIGTSVSDVLNRNFRELGSKIDRFSTELKHTNDNLTRLQEHVTNRVTHYGEENSRHFRYLCMKSEYDKMFYQHQSLIANKQQPSDALATFQPEFASKPETSSSSSKAKDMTARTSSKQKSQNLRRNQEKALVTTTPRSLNPMMSGGVPGAVSYAIPAISFDCAPKEASPYVCQSTQKMPSMPSREPGRTSSSHSIDMKSSDVGMREVLEHIQRFVTEMQYKEFSDDPQALQQQQQQQHQQQQQQQQKAQQAKHLQPKQLQQKEKLMLPQRGKKSAQNQLESMGDMMAAKPSPLADGAASKTSSTPKIGHSYGDVDDDFDISSDCLSLTTDDNTNSESDLEDYACHTARKPLRESSMAGDCK